MFEKSLPGLRGGFPTFFKFTENLLRAIFPKISFESSKTPKPIFGAICSLKTCRSRCILKFKWQANRINYYAETRIAGGCLEDKFAKQG